MFIECLGEVIHIEKNISNKFISNLKWDYIRTIIQINSIYVSFSVKYYIKNPKDIIYIWRKIKDYVVLEYDEYINNNITSMVRSKCEHCQFNSHYLINVEENITRKNIRCTGCNTRIDKKFIRDYENNYYHIRCFNKNPYIFKNNKNLLIQCNMCCKYINRCHNSLQYSHISNKYDIFKYIRNCDTEQSYTYMGDDNIYSILFLTKAVAV